MSKKRKKKKSSITRLKWFVGLGIFFFILSMIAYWGIVIAGERLVDENRLKMVESSNIYDRNGQEVGKLFIENREYVTFDQIPEKLSKAFVAVEDERFYEHAGIDFIAIARALYTDIMEGGAVQGGSTITQQLAKNAFLSHEKTLLRKTKEVLIAINLERKYSKDQILELYLNQIYFGHGAHGVQAASQLYFGKHVKDLAIDQMAMLAALPKAPNTYSPLNNPEKALERRNLVLQLMERNGVITSEERAQAEQQELNVQSHLTGSKEYLGTYVDFVIEEAREKYGISEDDIYRGGYNIYTNLDVNAQQKMYEVYQNDGLFPSSEKDRNAESGMVIIDPDNGGVVAMIGGRDYTRKGYNWAVTPHQPGSTFKPLAVYAPALEKGWHPYDLLKDEKMSFGDYKPRNYDGKYRGQVTMMEAIQQSYNVPAVWLLNELGIDTGMESAQKFGIPLHEQDRNLSIALGGLTEGASPLQMAQAYSAFLNEGVMMGTHAIVKIESGDGVVIAQAEPLAHEVVSKQTAYYMTRMLERVVQEGTGTNARMQWPVAGKTGTTQFDKVPGTNKDAWFVGYTPYYVGAVWLGFDTPDENNYLIGGSGYAAGIFREVMKGIHQGLAVKQFEKPDGVEELQPPIRLEKIDDLSAQLALDTELRVQLIWTPNEDKRVKYRIYRFEEDIEKRELVGETSDYVWMGEFDIDRIYNYVVVPVNPLTDEEGEVSNVARVDLMLLPTILDFGEGHEGDMPEDVPEDQPEEGEDPRNGNGENENDPDDQGNTENQPSPEEVEDLIREYQQSGETLPQWLIDLINESGQQPQP